MTSFDAGKALEGEILRLFHLVRKMRKELASVYESAGEGRGLDSLADQLDTIVQESGAAAETMRDASDKIKTITDQLSKQIKYAGARDIFALLDDERARIDEAVSVHDQIGARIANVVTTINTVEGTINSLVVILGDGNVKPLSSALETSDKEANKP